jgi:protein-disulfide isomerase
MTQTLRAAFLLLLVVCGACGSPAGGAPPRAATAAAPADAGALSATGSQASEVDAAVPIHSHNPSWGSRLAPVTIVEFSDFQCPFCRRVQPTLARIREAYGPQTVRFVWKNSPLPFHENARPAAEAAMGVLAHAGNEGFWRFHDLAFDHQEELGLDAFEKWARAAGVTDVAGWRASFIEHAWTAAVEADVREAEALGVDGTPSFFINGVSLVGAQSLEAFQAVIDDQVRAARAKIDAGTPPDRVYAELARENRAKAPKEEPKDDEPPEDTKTVNRVPVGKSPVLGNPNALVTIVEFSDFQCPYCARVEPTLKAIRDKYGDKVRIVWKNEPLSFHPWAEPAAEAALEVRAERGDAAFWQMHDALFANQSELAEAVLVKLATAAGARADSVRKAIANHAHARDIEADLDLAEDFDAGGTPTFFVNGRRLVGAQPPEAFAAIIDEEVARAQGLLAKGTRAADLYDALVRDGKEPPPPETRAVPGALPANDPVRGGAGARVTIHEWSDFQCPFCARVEPTIARLLKDYGPRVRLVWHDFPLPMHADALLAARAAREAYKQKGNQAFWDMHDTLFRHQDALSRDSLDGYARELTLDMDRWRAALDAGAHADEIDADSKAADEARIQGTPGFLIVAKGATSGYFLGGAQSYSKFRKVVDRALAEAK